MGEKILMLTIVAFIVIIWSSFIVGVHSSSLSRHRRQTDGEEAADAEPKDGPGESGAVPAASGDNTTTTTMSPSPASVNTTHSDHTDKSEDSSTVTVTVVIIILVIAVVLGVAVFVFLRIRKKRMADYEKKTQIQMSSTSNAGVYIDLTSAPAGQKTDKPDSPETEHLNKEEE